MADILDVVKRAALGAVDASNPMRVMFGVVQTINPLSINVEQKLTLNASQLVLTQSVTNHIVTMTVNHTTEEITHSHGGGTFSNSAGGINGTSGINTHAHEYVGEKTFTVNAGLKVGDKVILLREQGGQRFVVLDRLGE